MQFKVHVCYPLSMHNYLTNRTYQVRVGKNLSEIFHSTGGLPQGSIPSPLFC